VHATQQKATLIKYKVAVVIQAAAGRCAAGPWIWANIVLPLFVIVHCTVCFPYKNTFLFF